MYKVPVTWLLSGPELQTQPFGGMNQHWKISPSLALKKWVFLLKYPIIKIWSLASSFFFWGIYQKLYLKLWISYFGGTTFVLEIMRQCWKFTNNSAVTCVSPVISSWRNHSSHISSSFLCFILSTPAHKYMLPTNDYNIFVTLTFEFENCSSLST